MRPLVDLLTSEKINTLGYRFAFLKSQSKQAKREDFLPLKLLSKLLCFLLRIQYPHSSVGNGRCQFYPHLLFCFVGWQVNAEKASVGTGEIGDIPPLADIHATAPLSRWG